MNPWRKTNLGDEIDLAYGKALPTEKRQPGPFCVYGSNGIVGYHSDAIVSGPGIVIGRKGSVGEVAYSENAFWPIDTTYYVVNKGKNDWRFLFFLLRHTGLTELNSHSTIPGLNRENVYSIEIDLPSLPEQEAIAAYLDLIQQKEKLELNASLEASALKRAAMRELFTRGLRGEAQKETEIGLVPESWVITKLGSLGRIGNGSTPKKTVSAYWTQGTFPWLTSAKVYDREIVSADQFITQKALDECHLPIVEPGAILVAITGQGKTLGHCAVLRTRATINQHIAYIAVDATRADPSFVRGYMETQYEYLRQIASGGGSTKGALTCGFLRTMPIPLPSIPEQREIVAILDAIDRKIHLHRRKAGLLQELFTALLHKLMTGEIRVGDLDLSALESGADL